MSSLILPSTSTILRDFQVVREIHLKLQSVLCEISELPDIIILYKKMGKSSRKKKRLATIDELGDDVEVRADSWWCFPCGATLSGTGLQVVNRHVKTRAHRDAVYLNEIRKAQVRDRLLLEKLLADNNDGRQ